MTDKLKPCPFCGWTATVRSYGAEAWYVICDGCNVRKGLYPSREKAIYLWNKRAEVENDQ